MHMNPAMIWMNIEYVVKQKWQNEFHETWKS